MNNDPFRYLSGVMKSGIPKSADRAPKKSSGSAKSMPESPGGSKAKAAGKKGVETKSASSDEGAGAAKRVKASKANIEGNESPKYEKMEKKTLRSLKQGGSEKELRAGHNNVLTTSTPTRTTTVTRTPVRPVPKPGPRLRAGY